jgi:hypothetical protein
MYMIAQFPALVHALQYKMAGLNWFYGPEHSSLNEMLRSCKCRTPVSKVSSLANSYNWMRSLVVKKYVFFNILKYA